MWLSARNIHGRGTIFTLGIDCRAVGSRFALVCSGVLCVSRDLARHLSEHVAIYAEALDLSRFNNPSHQENFRRYLREKYREKNIGVIVAVGPLALEFMLSARSELWSTVPLVFSTVDESTVARLKLPPDVTGSTIQLTLRDMVAMARVLVPKLERFALVGEALEGRSIYRNFKEELPQFTSALEFIDLTGLPMTEVKERVAALPENTAILYTAIFIDGAGIAFDPTDALTAIAEVANRPIVVSTETQLGHGAVGGVILRPGLVGDDAARLTLRILNGESAANIPIVYGNYAKPMFDWRQLTRWGSASSGCRQIVRSAFANRVCGINTTGLSLPLLPSCWPRLH